MLSARSHKPWSSIENHQGAARRRAARLKPLRPHGRTHAAGPGQTLVEFAFVVPVFLLLLFSIVDFGVLFENRIALDNAARSGARWATTHPTAWSNASSAPSNTIEGRVQRDGGTVTIPNANITITYLVPGSGPAATPCGHYNAGTNSFQPVAGYTQSTCVVPGNLVQVQVSNTYHMITPIVAALFHGGITESTSATMMEEQ